MKRIKVKGEGRRFSFVCPGCKMNHTLNNNTWKWNGKEDFPTFTPSLLVTCPGSEEDNIPAIRCHSYITDGKIQFLSDCTHDLKNHTVDLLEIEQ